MQTQYLKMYESAPWFLYICSAITSLMSEMFERWRDTWSVCCSRMCVCVCVWESQKRLSHILLLGFKYPNVHLYCFMSVLQVYVFYFLERRSCISKIYLLIYFDWVYSGLCSVAWQTILCLLWRLVLFSVNWWTQRHIIISTYQS